MAALQRMHCSWFQEVAVFQPNYFPKYLSQGANFSFDSPALPLTYTLKYISNGTVAQINAATAWTTTVSYAAPEVHTYSVALGHNSNGRTRTQYIHTQGTLVNRCAPRFNLVRSMGNRNEPGKWLGDLEDSNERYRLPG